MYNLKINTSTSGHSCMKSLNLKVLDQLVFGQRLVFLLLYVLISMVIKESQQQRYFTVCPQMRTYGNSCENLISDFDVELIFKTISV